ncbi:hypothetical protein HMPREF1211_05290 [Streptomyces sp. HGB0020]|nr:hypothetical protein HMPREF1211_05290 [Streptomyces sp. HGB0020]
MPGSDPSVGGGQEGSPQWGPRPEGAQPPAGAWAPPVGPPQKRRRGRGCLWGCAGALVAVIVIVVVVLVAVGGSDDSTTPAPSAAATSKASPGQAQEEPASERADLISFRLDDRSQAGLTDVWVVWTVRNSSGERSDYSWEWEAVDAGGTRVANGSELETDVQPGQTARGEDFTTLKGVKGVKLNITRFNRTASY